MAQIKIQNIVRKRNVNGTDQNIEQHLTTKEMLFFRCVSADTSP